MRSFRLRFAADSPGPRRLPTVPTDRTPSIGSPNFSLSRQTPNRIAHVSLREARREQQLDLLATLATSRLEQLRRVLRIHMLTEQRQHRELQLAPRHASKRLRIPLAHAPRRCAAPRTTCKTRAPPCKTRTTK